MKVIIFLVLLTFSTGFAQDLAKLFENDLPQVVVLNNVTYSQANKMLVKNSKISPDLIYYCIKFLEVTYSLDSKVESPFKDFNLIVEKYEYKKNQYTLNLRKEMEDANIEETLKKECISYIGKYVDEDIKDIEINMDQFTDYNLLNFYAVKYYLDQPELKYDETANYVVIRDSLELKRVATFKDMQANPSKYSKDDLESLFDNWSILNKDNLSNSNINLIYIISELIRGYSLNDKLFKTLSANAGISFSSFTLKTSNDIYENPKFPIPSSDYSFNTNPVIIGLNFKIFLNQYIRPFNYINFQLSVGYTTIDKTITLPAEYRESNVDGISNRYKIMQFKKNEIKANSGKFASFNISIPVFYFGHTISFDPGFGLAMYITNYDISYNYDYRKFESHFLGPTVLDSYSSGPQTKNETSTKFISYPFVNVHFYFNKLVSATASVSTKYISFDLGINLW